MVLPGASLANTPSILKRFFQSDLCNHFFVTRPRSEPQRFGVRTFFQWMLSYMGSRVQSRTERWATLGCGAIEADRPILRPTLLLPDMGSVFL